MATASVSVDEVTTGAIGAGILLLIGVERADDEANATRLLQRVLGYRIFADSAGRMNLSLAETGGGLLVVPQFTLAADTSRGNRPGFSEAAAPEDGERLYEHFAAALQAQGIPVATGRFGADMAVSLVNDGPVTIWFFWAESPLPNAASGSEVNAKLPKNASRLAASSTSASQ